MSWVSFLTDTHVMKSAANSCQRCRRQTHMALKWGGTMKQSLISLIESASSTIEQLCCIIPPWRLEACERRRCSGICRVILVCERKSELSEQRERQWREQKAFSKCATLSSFHLSSLSFSSAVAHFRFSLSFSLSGQTCTLSPDLLLAATFLELQPLFNTSVSQLTEN